MGNRVQEHNLVSQDIWTSMLGQGLARHFISVEYFIIQVFFNAEMFYYWNDGNSW